MAEQDDTGAQDDMEARVTALETQMKELTGQVRATRQDAAAARVLAGCADRDVTEIRAEIRDFRKATTSSFNAMRDDLTDLRGEVTDLRSEMNERFRKVDEGFRKVDEGFIEVRGKLDATAAGQEQIVGLLTTLIDQQGEYHPS